MKTMHDFFKCVVTKDDMQNAYSACTNVVIVGWLERGNSNHTNTHTNAASYQLV